MINKLKRAYNELVYGVRDRTIPVLQDSAIVNKDTSIRMLEYDLYKFRCEAPANVNWGEMVRHWAGTAKDIEIYYNKFSNEAAKTLDHLLRDFQNIKLYNFSKANFSVYPLNVLRKTPDFHFTVFNNPDQLWIERRHSEYSDNAFGCEYIDIETNIKSTENKLPVYNRLKKVFNILNQQSKLLLKEDLESLLKSEDFS